MVLPFFPPKPSPLGRVAEQSEAGRGFCAKGASGYAALFRQPLRAATFPKGEGMEASLLSYRRGRRPRRPVLLYPGNVLFLAAKKSTKEGGLRRALSVALPRAKDIH